MDEVNLPAFTDPADWASTRLSVLQPLDALLRCQICKDFLSSAVITSCSHTFCSLCIRRCLAAGGRCPSCTTSVQESNLRRNVALQEAVDAFLGARDPLLLVARERPSQKTHCRDFQEASEPVRTARGVKRKRTEEVEEGRLPQAPRTRSQRLAASQKTPSHPSDEGSTKASATVVDSDGTDAEYNPPNDSAEDEQIHEANPQNDGLVACPICHRHMREELVFPHTDTCTGTATHSSPPRRPSSSARLKPSFQHLSRPSRDSQPPPERLPQINYSLLRDQALKKKLSDLRIPNWGPRALLIRRHGEWLALWNANCDSSHPRSRKELQEELDKWERSQGGMAPAASLAAGVWGSGSVTSGPGRGMERGFTAATNIMQKDFNSEEWSNNNRDNFQELIEKAREKKKDNQTSHVDQDQARRRANSDLIANSQNTSGHVESVESGFCGTGKHSQQASQDNADLESPSRPRPDPFPTPSVSWEVRLGPVANQSQSQPAQISDNNASSTKLATP